MVPKTILIAATDPNIIYLLQRYAEASGFQSTIAGQGEDLQAQAQCMRPDLIVLEMELPEVNAVQALRQLKANPATRGIPVVVYSCFDEINGATVDGAACYLQKSVMYSDFLAALEQAGI